MAHPRTALGLCAVVKRTWTLKATHWIHCASATAQSAGQWGSIVRQQKAVCSPTLAPPGTPSWRNFSQGATDRVPFYSGNEVDEQQKAAQQHTNFNISESYSSGSTAPPGPRHVRPSGRVDVSAAHNSGSECAANSSSMGAPVTADRRFTSQGSSRDQQQTAAADSEQHADLGTRQVSCYTENNGRYMHSYCSNLAN